MEYKTLKNGAKLPLLGYGTFEIPDKDCESCVTRAIELGYGHIDTAQLYGNERGVGRAIKNCGVPREELFITSKVWVKEFGYEKTLKSIDLSLKKLQTDYIDLMLLHRPYFDYINAWRALERAYGQGKVKAIGLSNFTEKQTAEIMNIAKVQPAVNQIELHPYFSQKDLTDYLDKNGVAVQAWYPLGHGNKKLLGDKVIASVAEKHGKTPSQIILRWHVQSGFAVFPKTRSIAHLKENMEIFSFELSDGDMAKINGLDKGKPLFSVPDWFQKLRVKLGL